MLNKKKRLLLIVVNYDWFFLSHRKTIAIRAKENGYNVVVVAKDSGCSTQIKGLGFDFQNLPIDKAGINIFKDFQTFIFLTKLYRKHKPDIVHHVGLKTILWGNFAASFYKKISVVNAISGLGVVFSDNKNILATILLKLVRISYYKNPPHSIFQNHDDRDLFLEHKIINNRNYSIINGSGVDLKEFSYMPEKISGVLNIVFTARMIKGKGVLDVIQAAEILRHKYLKKIKFILCGKVDENPNAIDEKYLNEVCDNDYIVYKGHTKEIKNVLGLSNLVILPSYYREGIPKSLIEATAIGRPIITTNSIGCKETVIDGFNGFLVPPKSPNEIAEKIKILINDHHLRKIMGKNSRIIAERKFSILEVEKRHLEIYNELING